METPDQAVRTQAPRYLGWFAAGAVTLIAATFSVGIAAYRMRENDPTHYLLRYQSTKLERGGTVDTVFIGDSSLGNGIDSAHFDELSGRRSLNLALTGMHGVEGSANMLKRALRLHPEIRNVVVVQTADMLQRPASPEGFLYSLDWAHWKEDAGEGGWREKATLVSSAFAVLGSTEVYKTFWKRLRATAPPGGYVDRDYIRQGAAAVVRPELARELRAEINPRKLEALEQLARFCRERKLNLVYAHGPLYEGVYARSRGYFDLVEKELAARNIPLLPEVMTATADQMGDTADDHIAGPHKKQFTERYFRALRGRLVGD